MIKLHLEPAFLVGFAFDKGWKDNDIHIPWRGFLHLGPITVEFGWTK